MYNNNINARKIGFDRAKPSSNERLVAVLEKNGDLIQPPPHGSASKSKIESVTRTPNKGIAVMSVTSEGKTEYLLRQSGIDIQQDNQSYVRKMLIFSPIPKENKSNLQHAKVSEDHEALTKAGINSLQLNKIMETMPHIEMKSTDKSLLSSKKTKFKRENAKKTNNGVSARDEFKAAKDTLDKDNELSKFLEAHSNKLHPELIHLLAHSHCSNKIQSANKSNIAAATSTLNTKMILTESVALDFAKRNYVVEVSTSYNCIENTNVVNRLEHNITVYFNGNKVSVKNSISNIEHPALEDLPRKTDTQLLFNTIYSMLHDDEPIAKISAPSLV